MCRLTERHHANSSNDNFLDHLYFGLRLRMDMPAAHSAGKYRNMIEI